MSTIRAVVLNESLRQAIVKSALRGSIFAQQYAQLCKEASTLAHDIYCVSCGGDVKKFKQSLKDLQQMIAGGGGTGLRVKTSTQVTCYINSDQYYLPLSGEMDAYLRLGSKRAFYLSALFPYKGHVKSEPLMRVPQLEPTHPLAVRALAHFKAFEKFKSEIRDLGIELFSIMSSVKTVRQLVQQWGEMEAIVAPLIGEPVKKGFEIKALGELNKALGLPKESQDGTDSQAA